MAGATGNQKGDRFADIRADVSVTERRRLRHAGRVRHDEIGLASNHAIDAHAKLRAIMRHIVGEELHAGSRRRIGVRLRRPAKSSDRRDIDEGAFPAPRHAGHNGARHVEHRIDVGVEHRPPFSRLLFEKRPFSRPGGGEAADGVDQRSDRLARLNVRDKLVDRGAVGQIDRMGARAIELRRDPGDGVSISVG
jgi:hypothetical protein